MDEERHSEKVSFNSEKVSFFRVNSGFSFVRRPRHRQSRFPVTGHLRPWLVPTPSPTSSTTALAWGASSLDGGVFRGANTVMSHSTWRMAHV